MEKMGCDGGRKASPVEYFHFMDTLDSTDLQILRALQENSQRTTKELAQCVNLYQGCRVFCTVKMSRINREIASDFTRRIRAIPEVTECYNIAGDYDYLLKIHAPDMKYYQTFLLNVLGTIDYIGSIHSIFVMDEVKREYGIHI